MVRLQILKKPTKNKYTNKVWHAYIQYPVDCKNENELIFLKLYVPIFIDFLLISKLCCMYLILLFDLACYMKTVTFKLDKKSFKTYINFWNFQLWITVEKICFFRPHRLKDMNGFDTKRLTDDGSSQTITDSADSFFLNH